MLIRINASNIPPYLSVFFKLSRRVEQTLTPSRPPMAGRQRNRLSGGRTRRERAASPALSDDHSEPATELSESSPPPPFFNTTFSTYRVSPLHLGAQPLTIARLEVLAQRLRDIVVGDVVRGVEVGLEGDDMGMPRAGALELVDISWVTVASTLDLDLESHAAGRSPSRDLSGDAVEPSVARQGTGAEEQSIRRAANKRALHISLAYENTLCTALLLPPVDEDGASIQPARKSLGSENFLSLPLLLLRMPAPLRPVIIDFLSTTFDCRISPLRLGTRSLVTSLELWMETISSLDGYSSAKDVVLSLGFDVPIPETRNSEADDAKYGELGLRAIDVIISASELDRFYTVGSKLSDQAGSRGGSKRKPGWEEDLTKRRKLAGRLYEEGWEWRRDGDDSDATAVDQPFFEALGRYFDSHLALNLFDPRLRITRIACEGFVMSEGRVKIFPPQGGGRSENQMGPVMDLLGILTGRATGRGPESRSDWPS